MFFNWKASSGVSTWLTLFLIPKRIKPTSGKDRPSEVHGCCVGLFVAVVLGWVNFKSAAQNGLGYFL